MEFTKHECETPEELDELLKVYKSKGWKIKNSIIISPTNREWTLESALEHQKGDKEAIHAFAIYELLWNKNEFKVPAGYNYLLPK